MRFGAWLIGAWLIVAWLLTGAASAAPGLDFSKPLVLRAGSSICRKPMVDCHKVPLDVPVAIVAIAKPYFLLHALQPGPVAADGWIKSYMLRNGYEKDCAVLKEFGTNDPDCAK